MWIQDLSTESISVLCRSSLKVGSNFEIEMALSMNGRLVPMRLHGQITHVHLAGDEFFTRLGFVHMKPECEKTILTYIKYRLNL